MNRTRGWSRRVYGGGGQKKPGEKKNRGENRLCDFLQNFPSLLRHRNQSRRRYSRSSGA